MFQIEREPYDVSNNNNDFFVNAIHNLEYIQKDFNTYTILNTD